MMGIQQHTPAVCYEALIAPSRKQKRWSQRLMPAMKAIDGLYEPSGLGLLFLWCSKVLSTF